MYCLVGAKVGWLGNSKKKAQVLSPTGLAKAVGEKQGVIPSLRLTAIAQT